MLTDMQIVILQKSCFSLQVMHGGLFSEPNVTLDDIRKIDRNRQPPEKGICLFSACFYHVIYFFVRKRNVIFFMNA